MSVAVGRRLLTALRGRSGPPEATERPVRPLFGLGVSYYPFSKIVAPSSIYAAISGIWDCRFGLAKLLDRRNRRLMLATQQFGPELRAGLWVMGALAIALLLALLWVGVEEGEYF